MLVTTTKGNINLFFSDSILFDGVCGIFLNPLHEIWDTIQKDIPRLIDQLVKVVPPE